MRGSGVFTSASLTLLLVFGVFVGVYGNVHRDDDDEWLDPFDMLNYDATSQTMRKPAETSSCNNVPTKRREYNSDGSPVASCPDVEECTNKLKMMEREIEEHKRKGSCSSQQPTCYPVFKRFLSKLLREIEKHGLPSDMNDEKHYDAEVKLSKQMVGEIEKLLEDDGSWRTGGLDDALSQILTNFKLHDHEAWKWRFEDTFGVEPDTIIKVSLCVLLIAAIICTEVWSVVSWFVQFKRMFAICFFISVIWNWCFLYKSAFADHQANMVKMENVNEKCTGVKKFDWIDNMKEWFRTTMTLQDDPCKRYYEVLVVNPILLVPPTKAITMTITTFITDPLKHIGQGISEFLRALLKDLPVTLQIPVLICIVIAIVVFMYSSGQAAIHHAVMRPLGGARRDPPPRIAQQPHNPPLRYREEEEEAEDVGAGGDVNHNARARQQANLVGNRSQQNSNPANRENRGSEVRQRRPKSREAQQGVNVETLRNVDLYTADEPDTQQEAENQSSMDHVENLADAVTKEENATSAQNRNELNPQSVPKKHSASNGNVNSKTPGGGAEVGNPATALGATEIEEPVETVSTPVQESCNNASIL